MSGRRMFRLTRGALSSLPKSGPTDPIDYYRRPLVGWLFRERIDRGLALLPEKRYPRLLEVGYGAGAVLLSLSPWVDECHGIDLDADADRVSRLLAERGREGRLVRGSVCDLPYEDGSFDLVVCFSVLEHLHDYRRALSEVARVLAPGGLFLLGMPAVNRMMEAAFRAIGFRDIQDHHVTTPEEVAAAFGDAGLVVRAASHLDVPAPPPLGLRLYYDWLLARG